MGTAGEALAPELSTNDPGGVVILAGAVSTAALVGDGAEAIGSVVAGDAVDPTDVDGSGSVVVDVGIVVVVEVVVVVDSMVDVVVVSSAATGAPMSTRTSAATTVARDPNVRGPVCTVIGATVVRIRWSLRGRSRTRAIRRP